MMNKARNVRFVPILGASTNCEIRRKSFVLNFMVTLEF